MRIAFKLNALALVVLVIPTVLAQNEEKLKLFRDCIVSHGVPSSLIVEPSNSSYYEELDYRWSTRQTHVHPLAYYVPTSTAHVQTGVVCARQLNIPVIAKSGGHSAELFSSGSPDTLVISFYEMNKIVVSFTDNTATMEPGAVLTQIKEELWRTGQFGVAAGVCPDVGIAGLALGGGEGVVTPLYGLTLDNVLEMEMVDANGEVHIVNEGTNPDLYWALRGSGSGYLGIVTKFKLKLFKASNLKLSVVQLFYPEFESTGPVLQAYQAWLKYTIDERLTVDARMAMGYHFDLVGTRIFIQTTLVEDRTAPGHNDTNDFFDLVKRSFPPTENATISFPPYNELRADITNESGKVPIYVKMSSFYVDKVFSSSELEEVVAGIQAAPNHAHVLLEGSGGVVYHQVPPTDTAFVHRDNLYLFSIRINGLEMTEDEESQATAWYDDIVLKSKFMDNGGSYQNYVDLDLGEDYMDRYYGVNAPRLIEIKRKWDPENYFKNPQSIPVLISGPSTSGPSTSGVIKAWFTLTFLLSTVTMSFCVNYFTSWIE